MPIGAPLAPSWLRTLLTGLVAVSAGLTLVVLATGGFDPVPGLGLSVSARDPLKPGLVCAGLVVLRGLAGLPGRELGLLAFGTAWALGLGELGLRVLDHPWARAAKLRGLHRPDPELGWELIPGASGYDPTGYHVAINPAGFRDRAWSLAKAPGVERIAVVGDSFTFGMGVEARDLFTTRLQELLGPGYEVMNFGVVGYNIHQCELTYRNKVAPYHPDRVVYAAFHNDVTGPYTPEQARALQDNPLTQAPGPDPPSLLGRSYLFKFLNNARSVFWEARHRSLDQALWLRSVADRQRALTEQGWKPLLTDPNPPAHFLACLARFDAACRAQGSRFGVLYIPDIAQLGDPGWQGFDRWLAARCRELAVPFRAATPGLEAAGPPEALYLLPHDAHLSPRGHQVLAQEARALLSD